MKLLNLIISVVICFSVSAAQAQIAQRSSLGLEGASLLSLTSTDDATLIFAGVDGPNGLYYSTDFGGNWILGRGGDYEAGAISHVAVVGTDVYAVGVRGGIIYKAALPSGSPASWSPVWSKVVEVGENPRVTTAGTYLLIGNRGQEVGVFSTATDALVAQTKELPENHNAKAAFLSGTELIGFSEVAVGGGDRETHIFRAPFNVATGIIGDYQLSNRSAVGLPALPATIWNMMVTGSGHIYTAISGNNAYRSLDGGDNFAQSDVTTQFNSFCFSGDTVILGTYLTTDGGTNWTNLGDSVVSESGRIEDKACLIDPTNVERALIGSNRGAYKTTNLSNASPSFTQSYAGFEGVVVRTMSQSNDDPNRVVLGTAAGLAFTDDFTADSPEWLFPICPGGDCVGADRVLIDPVNDDHIYYGSGNIRRGVVDSSGLDPVITWSDFANKPKADANISVLQMYDFLPNTLVVGQCQEHGQQDGGLYFFNKTNATYQEVQDSDIKNKPISAFIALDAQTFFAAVGGFSDFPDQVDRYLVKSTDGGTSWDKIDNSVLSDTLLARNMVYHQSSDTLYVGTAQNPGINQQPAEAGLVYKLVGAKAGGTTWVKAADFPDDQSGMDGPASVTALTVDQETGDLFASSWEKIFVSVDAGTSWLLYYQGLLNEESYQLNFEREDDDEEQLGHQRVSPKSSRSGLTQAAQTGVYTLEGQIPRVACQLKLLTPCRKRVSPGTACRVRATWLNPHTKQKYSGVKVKLQRNKQDKSSGWKNLGKTLKTTKKGVRVFKLKAPKGWNSKRFIRAKSATQVCTTKSVRIRTVKRR